MRTRMAADRKRSAAIALGPWAARVLGGYALLAMHAWFVLKLMLPSDSGAMELAAGMAALTGLLASIAFVICTYGVLASAPDALLDERQSAERKAAFFGAFKYLVALLLIGAIGSDLGAKIFGFDLSIAVFQNYLVLLLATALVLPATLLAWRDSALEDD